MRALFLKIGFVLRYLWVKIYYYPNIKLEGLVFIEPNVTFKIEPEARITLKNRVYLKSGCVLECSGQGHILLEERVSIGHHACLGCLNSLIVEHDAAIGQACTVLDSRHDFDEEKAVTGQGYQLGHCKIGYSTILFSHSLVGPNASVAEKCMIWAHSVLTKTVDEPGTAWGGVPAVKKKVIYEQN